MFLMRSVRSVLVVMAVLSFSHAFAQGSLSVGLTTKSNGGKYAPKNVVAVWVEDSSGRFVKTLGRWAGTRKGYLVAWASAAGSSDTDAVSGATRTSHGSLTISPLWDLKDKNGAVVPDGTYTVRMELADSNATAESQNEQGTFTFVKGPTSSTQTTSGGGFTNVTLTYTASSSGAGGGSGTGGGTAAGGGSGKGGGSGGSGGGSGGKGGGSSGVGGGGSSGGSGGSSGKGGGSSRAGGGGSVAGDAGTGSSDVGGCDATGGNGMALLGLFALVWARRRMSR